MQLTTHTARYLVNSNKRVVPIRFRASSIYHIAAADPGPRILCGAALRGPLYADFHGGPARLCVKCWKAFQKVIQPEPTRLL